MSTNWTFGRKLTAGYVVIIALVVVMGFTAADALRSVVASKDHVITVTGENLVDAERLRVAASRRVVGVRGYLVDKAEADLVEIRVQGDEFGSVLARLRSRAMTPDETALLERVSGAANEHRAASERVIALRTMDAPREATMLAFDRDVRPRFNALLQLLDEFGQLERRLSDEASQRAHHTAASAVRLVIGLAVATVLLAVLIAAMLTRALRDSELRLSGIIATAMDAIIGIDAKQRIIVFNRAASEMFRLRPAQALGGTLDRFIPPQLQQAHRAHVTEYGATGATARRMGEARRLVGVRADGTQFPIAASISRSGEGERLLMTVIVRDITSELEGERAREAQLAAEAASGAKTEFLSRMSHELRTPLNAVLGFSQLLQSDSQDRLTERQRAQVESIHQAGWHLLALINDVLDVPRIEVGRLELNCVSVAMTDVLDETLDLLRSQAERWGVVLEPAYREQASALALGDPLRVRQVLLNVLSNAVKYNRPGGSVRIEVTTDADKVRVQVADSGLGMTREQLDHLYEPFNRLGRERSGIEGTGIGMALVHQLLRLMHGSIQVDSEPGAGTTVRISLPAATAPSAPRPPAAHESAAAVHEPQGVVLYIEDNPVNQMLVEQMLARWPRVRLVQADHGRQGIELARRLQPDLVLLDMRLPDMEGVQVLQALCADEATRDLRVVAVSASAMAQDIDRARRCGAMDYWTKPLDLDRFLANLRRLLPAHANSAGTRNPGSEGF